MTPCTNIRDLFYSQARAAATLMWRERIGMSSEINTERLATLMAAFENGEVFHTSNPFDVDDPFAFVKTQASRMVAAFAELAKRDTPFLSEDPPPTSPDEVERAKARSDHETALVVAGLLQGMWIGFEYAHREVYGDES